MYNAIRFKDQSYPKSMSKRIRISVLAKYRVDTKHIDL